MIEAEFVFEFAGVLRDAPPSFGEAHEAAKAKGFVPKRRQPVLDGRGGRRGPFDEQLHGRGG